MKITGFAALFLAFATPLVSAASLKGSVSHFFSLTLCTRLHLDEVCSPSVFLLNKQQQGSRKLFADPEGPAQFTGREIPTLDELVATVSSFKWCRNGTVCLLVETNLFCNSNSPRLRFSMRTIAPFVKVSRISRIFLTLIFSTGKHDLCSFFLFDKSTRSWND